MQVFTNQAQVSYSGMTTSSNITTGQIMEVLSASKTAIIDKYASGEAKTYVISIVNTGNVPYTNLTVFDDLGSYIYQPDPDTTLTLYPLTYVDGSIQYYQNGTLQTAPVVDTQEGLSISGINVPANGDAVLVYMAKVNAFAPLEVGSIIENTAEVSGGGLTAPILAKERITVREAANVTVIKSVSPKQVIENGQITYTFELNNMGNKGVEAADNLQLTDTFAPVLKNIIVYINGSILSADYYTYDEATGAFATKENSYTIAAATFEQDKATGAWDVIPGKLILDVVGTI